jgi:hypothetical protein
MMSFICSCRNKNQHKADTKLYTPRVLPTIQGCLEGLITHTTSWPLNRPIFAGNSPHALVSKLHCNVVHHSGPNNPLKLADNPPCMPGPNPVAATRFACCAPTSQPAV